MRRMLLTWAVAVAATATTGCGDETPLEPEPAALAKTGPTIERDIMEFVDRQGTYCTPSGGEFGNCFSHFPDIPDIFGVCDWQFTVCGAFDYAGVWERYLIARHGAGVGTTYSGKITEYPLADGRARVRIVLESANAQVIVVENLHLGNDFSFGIKSMGILPQDYQPGGPVVLGSHRHVLEYIAPSAGAPILDLVELFMTTEDTYRGYDFRSWQLSGSATGPMNPEAGYAPGTVGTFTASTPMGKVGKSNGWYINEAGGLVRLKMK